MHFDAGIARQELTKKATDKMKGDSSICCWSDLYQQLEQDIETLAAQAKQPPAYIMACLIDDLEADLVD